MKKVNMKQWAISRLNQKKNTKNNQLSKLI